MNNKKKSTIEIINRGYLWVNLPSMIIILLIWYCLNNYLGFNGKISVIIGFIIGWIYWRFTIKKWIKWSLDNNVDAEKLLKIGKSSLLLWDRKYIDEIQNLNGSDM